MAYTVLARKYRSRTFDDLVGQDAVATTLKNAVAAGRVHHGYLFTGTRGVGKTSSARILAKAMNCLAADAPTPTPCCDCESCRMVAEGEDIDVIEIDAASNTGVDNIRELRGNAVLRPARSRFKIYIIDEVHMLSTGAFNALLKTLEEPPDHVKFILATTEIQKVPATIVSRCQRFDFKAIGPADIAAHLETVLKAEGIKSDDSAIRRVARLANGSMRDALSLLDQLLSFGGGQLSIETLNELLPVVHDETIFALVDHLAEEDAAGALECVERSISTGQTPERFCEMLIEHFRALMLLNVCGRKTDLLDVADTLRDDLVKQSERFDADTFVYMVSLVEEVRRSVKSSSVSRALLDAAVVRLALAKNFTNIQAMIDQLEGTTSRAGAAPDSKKKRPQPGAAGLSKSPKSSCASNRSAAGPPSRPPAPPGQRRTSPPTPQEKEINSADKAQACRDPNVQRAMSLFDGSLAGVRRTTNVAAKADTVPESDEENSRVLSTDSGDH